jgi:PII-like signaling protein
METEHEVTFVRIYLHEADHGRRHTLMQEIMTALKDQHGVKGVTVFRGIAGLGESGQIQSADLLRLMVDLPLVIEFYDEPAITKGVIRTLNGLVTGHAIVSWNATLTDMTD